MVGYLSPLLVHSDDSNTVCGGNGTSDQYHEWRETIYSQLYHWMAAQAAVSLLLVILSLVGKAHQSIDLEIYVHIDHHLFLYTPFS